MSEYDVPRPRPHGSARFYGTDNFGDDMATASEALYHGNVSQQEIDEEKPPLLKVKIEVLKDIIAKKIGLPDKGPMSGKSYWSLVNTSMFTDGLLDNVTHKSTIQKNIQDEFDMWENWWELFKK